MTATAAHDHWPGRVRAVLADDLGEEASVEEGFGPLTVAVPPARWVEAAVLVRDDLDCSFFDFLSAVDELDEGFRVVCHLAAHRLPGGRPAVRHLLLATSVPRDEPVLATLTGVFAGAAWHERETQEMFGVRFRADGPDGEVLDLAPLLLPEEFEGHPLRKDFVLASRVAKPWPGAKEPGESDDDASHDRAQAAPSRRRTRPPGVPTPEEWGPR